MGEQHIAEVIVPLAAEREKALAQLARFVGDLIGQAAERAIPAIEIGVLVGDVFEVPDVAKVDGSTAAAVEV